MAATNRQLVLVCTCSKNRRKEAVAHERNVWLCPIRIWGLWIPSLREKQVRDQFLQRSRGWPLFQEKGLVNRSYRQGRPSISIQQILMERSKTYMDSSVCPRFGVPMN